MLVFHLYYRVEFDHAQFNYTCIMTLVSGPKKITIQVTHFEVSKCHGLAAYYFWPVVHSEHGPMSCCQLRAIFVEITSFSHPSIVRHL